MKREKRVRSYKQKTVNAVVLVVVILLLIYLGIQFSRNFSQSLSTQRAQTVTVTDYKYLKGYVFRDESLILGESSTVCDFLLEDGSRVGVGQKYAELYRVAEGADKKQAELNSLSERIRRLRSKVSADGYVSELPAVRETLNNSYYAYINAIIDGRLSAANGFGDRLLDSIVDYNVITGKEGEISDVGALLEAQKSELISSFGASGGSLVSDESFYLCYGTDGYESVFTPDKLSTLDLDGLEALIASQPKSVNGRVLGRAIGSPEWFLAIPVSADDVVDFTDKDGEPLLGATLEVTLTGSDRVIKMILDSLHVEESGEGLLVLSSFDLSVAKDLARAQSIKIKMSSLTGYRIPTEALAEQDGEKGVYILVGTVVEFRRVTVLGEKNGYLIVSTYESDSAEQKAYEEAVNGGGEETPLHDYSIQYLKVNDLIITSGNDLYDGKLID